MEKKDDPSVKKPRPLLIKMNNENEKWLIIKNAKKLKDETDPIRKQIGLAKDLTKKERETQKKLIADLRHKRENEQGIWIIKNGKVIKVTEQD